MSKVKIIKGLAKTKNFEEVKIIIFKCPSWEEEMLKKILKKGISLIEKPEDGMLIIEKAKKNSKIQIEAIYKTLSMTQSSTEYNNIILAISYMINSK